MSVVLEEHRLGWAEEYREEAHNIRGIFEAILFDIHHIGSTSVPGLLAKPIIDLLAEVSSVEACDLVQADMENLGYEAMGEFGIPGRRYYRKFSPRGNRTHHLHVFRKGSPDVVRHLAFRDFLRQHPNEAQAYADLKRRLVVQIGNSWENYVDGKADFVLDMEQRALEWRARNSLD